MNNSIKKNKMFLRVIISLLTVSLFSSSVTPAEAQAVTHSLSPRWASQSPDLKLKVLKILGETVKKYPEKIENAITIFDSYLDFTSSDVEQVRLNIAVLNMLAELPSEFKTLKIVLNAVNFIEYEGECKESLHQAGLKFFRSIPKKTMYKKRNGRNNLKYANLSKAEKIYCREIRKYHLLTHIGEIKLFVLKRMGESEEECHEARRCLITSNLRIPFDVVRKYFWWTSIDMNRLVSEGNLGVIRAVDKHDPCLGNKLSTYAEWWIKQFIKRFIKDQQEDLRLPVYVQQKISNFFRRCQETGLDPKDKSISDKSISVAIGMPVEDAMRLLKKLFSRVEKRIKEKEIEFQQPRLIAILRERFVPKVEQTGLDKPLENIGKRYDLSRERIRQLESRVIKYIEREAVTPEEKILINNLLRASYEQSQNSFAEFLRIIYKTFNFQKFHRKKFPFDSEKYSLKERDRMFMRLTQFFVLRRVKQGWYKVNPIFQGKTDGETEENIAGLYNMTFEKRGKRKMAVLDYCACSRDKIFTIKECVKMDLAHRLLGRMIAETSIERVPCTIRVWKGYATGVQEDLPQRVRNAMENGPYELKFLELNKLTDSANKNETCENEITILPFNRLSESQRKVLETGKIRFINMDFEKRILDPLVFVQLEAIIASGVAYLNNDDFTFNNLYKMLTDNDDDIKVKIEKLKENPLLAIKYIFILNPGKVNINDLNPLNERMKKLVDSAV